MNKIREVIRDMHRGLINVLDKSSDERNFVDIIFIAVAGAIVIVTACVCELILSVLIWIIAPKEVRPIYVLAVIISILSSIMIDTQVGRIINYTVAALSVLSAVGVEAIYKQIRS